MRRSNCICYLYAITRIATGQKYVGLTVKPRVRWWTHCWSAGRSPQLIHKAIAKHGRDAFSFDVIACSKDWRSGVVIEQQLIAQMESHVSLGGYNLTLGGEGPLGRICSAKTKEKISSANRGRGHKIPDEQRLIHRARTLATYAAHPEYRPLLAKLSVESRIRNGNTGLGRKNSIETLARMRDAAIKRWTNVSTEERTAHMKPALLARTPVGFDNPMRVKQFRAEVAEPFNILSEVSR